MIFEITVKVNFRGVLKAKETYTQEFADSSNVFERVYEFRQRMRAIYPNATYEVIKAKRIA